MKAKPLQWMLLLAFAIAVGDFAFRTLNPSPTPEYRVSGAVRPLTLPGSSAQKHLYLRRTWHLTEPAEHAWIQVLGHDSLEVFVNGRQVGRTPRVGHGRVGAVISEITPYLHVGQNSIAIHAQQLVMERPPEVAISATCEFANGRNMRLSNPDDWRVASVYDRRGKFWFETDFDDQHWVQPHAGEEVFWKTQVSFPPRAITEARRSQWISAGMESDARIAVVREFALPSMPRDGWLRVAASSPYSVAVNGWVVNDDRAELAMSRPYRAVERTFDVSALLRKGTNTISLASTTDGAVPRFRADFEAGLANGQREYIATDDKWRFASGPPVDWLSPALSSADWQQCQTELGFLGVVPRAIRRELAELRLPLGFWGVRGALYFVAIAACGLVAGVASSAVQRDIGRQAARRGIYFPPMATYVALLPSTVLAATAGLLTWDFAWTAHDFYQLSWLWGLVLLVVGQWLLMFAVAAEWFTTSHWPSPQISHFKAIDQRRRTAVIACWLLLIAVAFWLRARDLTTEPVHHDEVTAYMFTMSVLEHGFPGGQVHPDIPFGYCATNELTFYPTALCALFVDEPLLVVRIPSLLWSMATLLLLGYVGCKWFNPYVGFVAATLFALSPHVIGMANFGRYLCQVQFFALLTTYLTYEAVRGTGKIHIRALWGAALSFAAMYLSWEGTGIFGVGLALAVLLQRRHHLRDLFACRSLYPAALLVVLVVVGQNAHRVLQQTQRLWYGEGISSLTVMPMWRYPFFDVDYFLVNSSWTKDALLPTIAFVAACVLAVKHRWQYPIRFTIICLAMNALLMSALIPLRTNRYSYHLSQLLILLAAAVVVAGVEALFRRTREAHLAAPWRWHIRAVGIGALLVIVALMSGWAVRTSELKGFVTSAYDVRQLRNPDWVGPNRYMLDNLRKDDVIISIFPHAQNFVFATQQANKAQPRMVDYWLESSLILQATIGDSRDLPLDRRSGATLLYDVSQLEQLFAEHDRVWYCTMRYGHSKVNDSAVSKYLREHMDVVYEDFGTALMLRDRTHRTAPIRREEEEAGQVAADFYLR